MKCLFRCNNKGITVLGLLTAVAIIVFVIFPVFAAVIERYIILNKAQIIRDAVDLANISIYNALDAGDMGKNTVSLDYGNVSSIYRSMLATNLNLNPTNLNPLPNSIADGPVTIDSLVIYTGGFPVTCPNGTILKRPSVHSCVIIPVKPSLYRQIILDMMGKQYVELKIHVDTDIPVDN